MIEKYPIEKGVPIPKKRTGYPLLRMAVGDSFVVPKAKRQNVLACAGRCGVKIRTQLEGSESVRVWRVE